LNVVDVGSVPRRDTGRLASVDRPRCPLWVVESVEQIGTELEVLAFRDVEVLKDRKVHVPDAGQLQRVAARVRERAETRLDVLRVGVGGQVADNLTVCARQRRNRAERVERAGRV